MKNVIILIALLNTIQAKDFIDIYASYANSTELIVSGRVVDSKDKKQEESSNQSGTWQNLKKNLGNFSHDEKKNIDLTLEVNNFSTTIKTDDEGYFSFDIKVPLKAKQSVLLYTQNQKEVKEMREHFDEILKKSKIEKRAVFFVTGSPHQLQESINAFLDLHKFPKRVVLSKKIQGENADDLLSTIAYKYDKIVRLIEMYPQVTWVCFGDSGEKDRDVYLKVLKSYPKKVKAIYIRNVESKKIIVL